MKILVSGASGLIGRAVVEFYRSAGHSIRRLVRGSPGSPAEEILWDPAAGQLDAQALAGFDAVIHLAGESIAEGRWSTAKKARIRDSRVQGTQLLCQRLAQTAAPPKVLISASAIGWYGNRGDEELDEQSSPGSGFLAEVCREWEQATQAAAEAGIRTVQLRIGLVLAAAGGAIAKMATPFRLGLGGYLGSGRQYVSWIVLEDLVRVFDLVCQDSTWTGPVNAVAPQPVTNRQLTAALAAALHRPALLAVPEFALRTLWGEAADELFLSSARVLPRKLQEAGFEFHYPDLSAALKAVLG